MFVDTHGDFSADRMTEMAKNLRANVMKSINKDPALLKKYRDEFQVDKILSRVHYVRLLDEAEQNLFHEMLEQVVLKFPQLKLIVLDTFCEHLRTSEHGFAERKRTVANWLVGLQKVACKFGIAVVVVNNMKTGRREMQSTTDGQRDFAPAKPEPYFGEDLF